MPWDMRSRGRMFSAASIRTASSQLPNQVYLNLFPDGIHPRLRKGLVLWFGIGTVSTAGLIVLGGMTRLTRSGLSMTDWKFTGERPPMNDSDWDIEFSRYKASPEFRKVNRGISVDDFKFIYWMEYAHRMWGRSLGIIFGLPALYFAAKGAISAKLGWRFMLLMFMGGTQGFVGWWMVRSGLEEPITDTDVPRVSPYRLAMHLVSAFTIYSLLLWTTLSLKTPIALLHRAPPQIQSGSRTLRRWLIPLGLLVALTGVSGAFVAGNDAGRSYNTFPMMNGEWIPEEYHSMPILSKEHLFENTAAVQLHHRVLALTTAAACVTAFLASQRLQLLPITRRYLGGLAGMAVAQVTLGVSALLMTVPSWLGSAHQAGALILFSLILGSLHSLRPMHPSNFSRWLSTFSPGTASVGVMATGIWMIRGITNKDNCQS